jgi:hypothetical protein
MSPAHLTFHHFGLAVRQPEPARKFLAALGYRLGESVLDPAQNVHWQLATHTRQPAVEIIWPGGAVGPLSQLAQRHRSGIIYHPCYHTDDLPAARAAWEAAGLSPVCVSPPQPALLFGGRHVSFYNVEGVGLVEILEES